MERNPLSERHLEELLLSRVKQQTGIDEPISSEQKEEIESIKQIPHKGFVTVVVQSYVHSLQPTGKINGQSHKFENKSFLFMREANNITECDDKIKKLLNELLELLNGKNPTQQA